MKHCTRCGAKMQPFIKAIGTFCAITGKSLYLYGERCSAQGKKHDSSISSSTSTEREIKNLIEYSEPKDYEKILTGFAFVTTR